MTREQNLERRCANFKNIMKTLVGDRFEVNATVWNTRGLITTNDYLYLIGSEEIPEEPPLGLMPRHMRNKKRRDELFRGHAKTHGSWQVYPAGVD